MIISNSKKFIYIHIPKCGGTSVSHALEQTLRAQDINLGVNPHKGWDAFVKAYKRQFGLDKHSTAAKIAQAMGAENFKSYYTFTFSRNPFARAYSAYTFTMRADAKHRPKSERYQEIKDMSFEDFLLSRYMQEKLILPARSQRDWISGAPSEVQVFKLENLANELDMLMKKFLGNTSKDVQVSRRNSSSGEDDWKNMSSEAESIIRKLYQDDFEALSYEDRVPR